jgi:hypothetical protein
LAIRRYPPTDTSQLVPLQYPKTWNAPPPVIVAPFVEVVESIIEPSEPSFVELHGTNAIKAAKVPGDNWKDATAVPAAPPLFILICPFAVRLMHVSTVAALVPPQIGLLARLMFNGALFNLATMLPPAHRSICVALGNTIPEVPPPFNPSAVLVHRVPGTCNPFDQMNALVELTGNVTVPKVGPARTAGGPVTRVNPVACNPPEAFPVGI